MTVESNGPDSRGRSGKSAATRWKSGQSGNPGGKSAANEQARLRIKSLCAEKSTDALAKLFELLDSHDERVVLLAVGTSKGCVFAFASFTGPQVHRRAGASA